MVALVASFRYPVAPEWVESRLGLGLWQLDHESGGLPTIYRYAPGGARPSWYTESTGTGRRTYYPSLREAVRAVEAAAVVGA